MLLGLPGDNTYSNYAEANRSFWRQTVIPLVTRTAGSLAYWLGPAFDGALRLEPDLDGVDALAPEREALWARIGAAGFLTDDEKREAVGYGAKPGAKALDPAAEGVGGGIGDLTGSPIGGGAGGAWQNQPRVPAGNGEESGRWTSGGGSNANDRITLASNYDFGKLLADYETGLGRRCIYQFSFGLVATLGPVNFKCPVFVPSAAVTHGQLLNDN